MSVFAIFSIFTPGRSCCWLIPQGRKLTSYLGCLFYASGDSSTFSALWRFACSTILAGPLLDTRLGKTRKTGSILVGSAGVLSMFNILIEGRL